MAAAYAMLWRWGFATLFAIVTHFSTCIFVVAIYFNQQILVCLLLLSVFCLAGNVGEQFPCEIPLEWVVFEEYKPEKLCWSQRVVKMTHTNILRCMLFFYVYSIRNIVCTVGGLCHVHNLRNDQEFSGKSFFHGFKLENCEMLILSIFSLNFLKFFTFSVKTAFFNIELVELFWRLSVWMIANFQLKHWYVFITFILNLSSVSCIVRIVSQRLRCCI